MSEQPREWTNEYISDRWAKIYMDRTHEDCSSTNQYRETTEILIQEIRDDLTQQLATLTAENKQRLKGAGKQHIAALEEKIERLTVALEEYETSNFFYQQAAGKHLGYILTLEQRIADLETARAALQAENERLKATLDGDPDQTATPEQRRAWRLSAVRYADKVEAERDTLLNRVAPLTAELGALHAEIARLKAGTYQPVEELWLDFEWDITDAPTNPFGQRHWGYHIKEHPPTGQLLEMWKYGKIAHKHWLEGDDLALCRWQEGANNQSAMQQYLAGNTRIAATRQEWNQRYVDGWNDGNSDAKENINNE